MLERVDTRRPALLRACFLALRLQGTRSSLSACLVVILTERTVPAAWVHSRLREAVCTVTGNGFSRRRLCVTRGQGAAALLWSSVGALCLVQRLQRGDPESSSRPTPRISQSRKPGVLWAGGRGCPKPRSPSRAFKRRKSHVKVNTLKAWHPGSFFPLGNNAPKGLDHPASGRSALQLRDLATPLSCVANLGVTTFGDLSKQPRGNCESRVVSAWRGPRQAEAPSPPASQTPRLVCLPVRHLCPGHHGGLAANSNKCWTSLSAVSRSRQNHFH